MTRGSTLPWIAPWALSANTCGETIEICVACARKLAVLFSSEVEYQSASSCWPGRTCVATIRIMIPSWAILRLRLDLNDDTDSTDWTDCSVVRVDYDHQGWFPHEELTGEIIA